MFDLAPIDRTLPFAILLLPLAGFIVLALLGDRIKRDGEAAGARIGPRGGIGGAVPRG